MADTTNESAAERDKRWKITLDGLLDMVDRSTHLSDREKAARRAEIEAEHAELRAGADRYEADRAGYLGGSQ